MVFANINYGQAVKILNGVIFTALYFLLNKQIGPSKLVIFLGTTFQTSLMRPGIYLGMEHQKGSSLG
jgi:hypothetical protein